MTWTVKKITAESPITVGGSVFDSGYAFYSEGDGHPFRLRSIVVKRKHYWAMWRIRSTNVGILSLGGMDDFRSYAAAKDFVTNRPNIWGV